MVSRFRRKWIVFLVRLPLCFRAWTIFPGVALLLKTFVVNYHYPFIGKILVQAGTFVYEKLAMSILHSITVQ